MVFKHGKIDYSEKIGKDNKGKELTILDVCCNPELINVLSSDNHLSMTHYLLICRHNGTALQYIDNKNHEIEVAACKQNGNAIQYVREQTPQLQVCSVKSKPRSLQFIENPTEEAKKIALGQSPKAIKLIKNPTVEDYRYMLTKHWRLKTLKFIPDDCGLDVTREVNRMKLLYGLPD